MLKTSMLKSAGVLAVLAVSGLLVACNPNNAKSDDAAADMATPDATTTGTATTVEPETPMAEIQEMTIIGSAAYRERIALVPGGVFTVSLEDVSLADASSTRLAEYSLTLTGEQAPLPFTLTVKQHKIKTNMTYAVRATIRGADGALEWTTDTVHTIDTEPLMQDLGVLQMVRVGGPASDAAQIGDSAAADASAGDTLVGKAWQVEDINGGGVVDNSNVTMTFDATGKVTGSTGCNNYFGGYAIDANTLAVDALGSTRRGCAPALMDQETKFLAVLQDAVSWSFDDVGRVTLKTEDGRTLQAIGAAAPQ